jgi:hypothetical protein
MGQETKGPASGASATKAPALAPALGWSGAGAVRHALARLGQWLSQRGPGHWAKQLLRAPAPPDIVLPPEIAAARLLRAARALIAEEDRWVQGRYETLRGRRCAMGALQAAARALRDTGGFETARDLLRTEALIRGYSHVEKMNDRSTHAQVLAAFESAIARAGGGSRP